MWQPLMTADQLHEGDRLRQTVHEGNDQYITIYRVLRIGQRYYMVEMIEQNGRQLNYDQQAAIPFLVANIPNHGFEVWVDE